jgi:pimeloyl-ACP methyl ester carboxylesterase
MAYPAATQDRAGINLILGHGAGAGQTSDFIVSFARELAARGIGVVTFNFLYSEQGRRVPDPNDRLEACWRAVIQAVRERLNPGREVLAIGGKSMGGRIASQVAAADIGDLAGLILLGYPLHPPGRPIGFAPDISRTSSRRCCSFKVRAIHSALPTSCAQLSTGCGRLLTFSSWKAATTRSRSANKPTSHNKTHTGRSKTISQHGYASWSQSRDRNERGRHGAAQQSFARFPLGGWIEVCEELHLATG